MDGDKEEMRLGQGVPSLLTRKETQVLELMAAGNSTRQMAKSLLVTPQTIAYHVGNMFAKFGCENRAGLVSRAYVFGYLEPNAWPPVAIQDGARITSGL